MSEQILRFDTKKIRSSYDPAQHQNSAQVPIYQSAAFAMETLERADRLVYSEEDTNFYSRLGNPTVAVFEQRMADLDGGAAGIALASGMTAVTFALLNLTNIGDHIVTSPYVYGGVADAFKKVLPRFGVSVDTAIDITPSAIEAVISEQTRAIFIESISNPLGIVADIEAIAAVAHKYDIPLVVDNTLATPYLIRPFEFDADLVVYSATKGISGHGNIIAGLILESGKFDYGNGKFPQFSDDKHFTLRDRSQNYRTYLEVAPKTPITTRIRCEFLNYLGAALGPFDAYLALIGLETLSERLHKQQVNTQVIVEYLSQNEHVESVNHSSLPTSPNHQVAKRIAPKGSGSVFSFVFDGNNQQLASFIESTQLFSYLANIGDARSLIVNASRVTHSELTPEELIKANISDNLVRISIGLEDAQDLVTDLEQAFRIAFA